MASTLRERVEFVDKFMRDTGATDRQANTEFNKRQREKRKAQKPASGKKRQREPIISQALVRTGVAVGKRLFGGKRK